MRLFDFLKRNFVKTKDAYESLRPRFDWKNIDRQCRIYRPAEIANLLKESQPFFMMASGGKYAIAIRRNRKGKEIPACFIRVDKDRRKPKERKRMRRAAKALAEVTA